MRHPWRMHERDADAWRAIHDGERPPRWQDLFGHPDGMDYLSDEGRTVAERAAVDLEEFFGATWLPRAMDPNGPHGMPIPTLARFSPGLTLTGRAGAYVELVRWWAAVALLQQERVDGFQRWRKDARCDVRLERLLHTLTQARLAAAGVGIGATVTLEPGDDRGSADVLLEQDPVRVLIEVLAVLPDADFRQQTAGTDRSLAHLDQLARQHDLHWWGEVPGQMPPHELAAWNLSTSRLAAEVSVMGTPKTLDLAKWGALTASPGPAPVGTTLSGPVIESDQGHRLLQKVRQKVRQTRAAESAWIWVEDHGALQPFTPFQQSPLADRVVAFADLVADVLSQHPHLAGIVLSSGSRRVQPLPADQTVETVTGNGYFRGLPIDRRRETIVIPRQPGRPDQLGLLSRLCSDEPAWLSSALTRLGIAGGVSALLRSDPAAAPVVAGTPATSVIRP